MRIRADQRVRIGHFDPVLVRVGPDGLRQIFQVDLVADAGAGGHDAEVVKGGLTPFQEGIAFHVAFVFAVHVHLECARVAKFVDHDRVVDDQINRVQRVDLFCVPTQRHDGVAHGCKVNDCGHAGKVLQQDARRAIGDFAWVLAAVGTPFGKGLDIIDADGLAVFEPQHVFQHHLEGGGKAREVAKSGGCGGRNRVIVDGLCSNAERFARFGGVVANCNGHGGILSCGGGAVIPTRHAPW